MTINVTGSNDVFVATDAGDDKVDLTGSFGNDVVMTGSGNETVWGGSGADAFWQYRQRPHPCLQRRLRSDHKYFRHYGGDGDWDTIAAGHGNDFPWR